MEICFQLFRTLERDGLLQRSNVMAQLMDAAGKHLRTPDGLESNCHNLCNEILKQFFKLRLHAFIKTKKNDLKPSNDSSRGSKSIQMRKSVSSMK